MKRSVSLLSALLLAFGTVWLAVSPAQAAPPTAAWSARAGGDAAQVDLTAAALNLAAARLALSQADTGSARTPRSTGASSNLAAAIATLPITVVSETADAGPAAGSDTETTGIDAQVQPLLDVGALTVDNTARWDGDTACVPTGTAMATASTRTGGVSLEPLALAGIKLLSTGIITTTGRTELVTNSGLNRGVRSTSTGQAAGVSVLGLGINVAGTSTLRATASGSTGGAQVVYTPSAISVTQGSTTTPIALNGQTTFTVSLLAGALTATVTVRANDVTKVEAANGQSARGTVSAATVTVSIASVVGGAVVLTSIIDLVPLRAEAATPSGGIDCPPPAPVIGVPANNVTVPTTTPVISGTGTPGATINLTLDGTTTTNVATVNGGGNWTYTPTTPLAQGSHTATATQTVAGQTSPVSNTRTFTVDSLAPAAPIVTAPANGSTTRDRTPTFTGTAEADSTVRVIVDGNQIGTTTATAGGSWSFTDTTDLTDGSHVVTARAVDAAGNVSALSNANTFTVDGTAPNVAITTPTQNSSTNDTTPTFTGTAEAGSTVELTVNGTVIGTTTAVAGGTWTFTPTTALTPGAKVATATATDAVGNTSAPTPDRDFTIDVTAPNAPTITAPANGSSTNDITPTITGTAENNAIVTLVVDGRAPVTVTANGSGTWTYQVTTPLAPGSRTVTATQTDAASNVSPTATSTFTVDTTAPAAPTITTPTEGSSTNDTTPTFTGTAEIGTTVDLSVGGTVIGTDIPVSGTGTWTFTPTTPLTPGAKVATATATDAATNVSVASPARNFTIDTTVPAAPVILTPADGSSVNDTTPDITGTAEPGATVTLVIDGGTPVTVTAGPGGAWTYTPTAPLTEDPHTVVATQTDAAGNVSPTATSTFTVDVTPPAAPTITTPGQNSVTDDTTPTFTGTAPAGTTVTVRVDGGIIGTATATSGAWTFTPTTALPTGARVATATTKDAAGNVSPSTPDRNFTIDTTPPAVPVISTPTEGQRLNDTTPTVTGTGEPGATVTVSFDGTESGTALVAGNSTWTYTPTTALTAGTHVATAIQTDPAGNDSAETPDRNFVIDTTPPAVPVISTPTEGQRLNDTTPTVTGTGEPGATVTVSFDGTPAGTALVGAGSTWTYTPTTALAVGPHVVTATQTDAAGNDSPSTADRNFVIDTAAPAIPVITAPVDGSTTNDTTPPISGTGEVGATVTVRVNGTVVGTDVVSAGGAWSVTPATPLATGTQLTAIATQTDEAGNASGASAPVRFTIDAMAPAAPVITGPTEGATVQGPDVAVSGTGEPGASVVVTDDRGQTSVPVTVSPSGTWTAEIAAHPDGPATAVAVQTDPAGNDSPPSAVRNFVVDSAAPDAPVITQPVANSATTDTTPTIAGTGETGSVVAVSIDGTAIGTALVDGAGNWSLTPGTPLAQGIRTATAVQTDAGSNTSAQSDPVPFRIDTTRPARPVITDPDDGDVLADPTPTISGTGEAGATVVVTVDGTALPDVVVAGDDTWSVTVPTALSDGDYTATAVQTDPAGNASPTSVPVDFTIDTGVPAAPVITAPTTGTQTRDTTPTIRGTGEIGATVTVLFDGDTIGTAVVGPAGTWTFTPTTPLAERTYEVTATQTDAAGNTSPPSAPVTLTIDTTAPAAPVVNAPTGTIADSTPDITGTGVPGDTVTVRVDNVIVGTATVTGGGTWTVTPATALAEGAHTANATQADPAGNVSPVSNTVSFRVDTTEARPTITAPLDGTITNDNTPTITGTGDPGATVTVLVDGTAIGDATVADDGRWTLTPTTGLADGLRSITATQTDGVGNTSPPTGVVRITIDTQAPAAPVITAPAPGATTDATPTILGTGEPGATVTVIVDGDPVGTTTVTPGGTWTFTPTDPLDEGPHVVTATQPDPAGNVSPPSEPLSIVVDATAPAAPVITSPADGDQVSPTPTITGTAEPGSTVTVYVDDRPIGTVVADGTGAWSLTPTTPIRPGIHEITATATDAVGNVSDPSDPVEVVVPTDAAGPVITQPTQGSTVDPKVQVCGTGEPGDRLTVIVINGDVTDEFGTAAAAQRRAAAAGKSLQARLAAAVPKPDDGDVLGSVTVGRDGTWCIDAKLPEGTYTVIAGQLSDGFVLVSEPVSFRVEAVDTSGGGSGGGSGNGGLAETGGPSLLIAGLGSLLLLLGGTALVVARRRRSGPDQP